MELSSAHIKSNDVRVPQPRVGEALIVERYSSEHVKAVILHPDDFAKLQSSSEALEELALASGPELTDLGARAHRLAESPEGELVDDEASVKRLLGV
jgi:hypothetical protein